MQSFSHFNIIYRQQVPLFYLLKKLLNEVGEVAQEALVDLVDLIVMEVVARDHLMGH